MGDWKPKKIRRAVEVRLLTMRICALLCLCATAVIAAVQPASAQTGFDPSESKLVETRGPKVVHVAPPTGEREADRTSILAALDRAEPGDTIQFAPGTYLIGGSIQVSVPGVTLLGSEDGTTLRGCDPAELVDYQPMARRCAGLELTRGYQTVRGFTFEHMSWTSLQIAVPRDEGQRSAAITEGGHLIEDNTFRDSDRFDVLSDAAEPIVIRDNTFINTYHAVDIRGRNVHFLNNEISAPAPSRIPYGRADIAIVVGQFDPAGPPCANNLIAGNRIHGHPDGIAILVFAPGMSCRGNVVRSNTIRVSRVALSAPDRGWKGPEADSIQVGIAFRLRNYAGWCRTAPADQEWAFCPPNEGGRDPALVDNVFEGNRIEGGEGIAIEMLHASRNRIIGNTISGIEQWERFPDGVLYLSEWRTANGSAIWVSPGSDENEIAGNTFENIASSAIVLEGDSNHIEILNPSAVRDLGNGNRTTTANLPQGLPEEKEAALADTLRNLAEDFLRVWDELDPEPYDELLSDDFTYYMEGAGFDRATSDRIIRCPGGNQ